MTRLLDRLFRRADLPRADGVTFLTRWTVWGDRHRGDRGLYLHRLTAGDAGPVLHTHPWGFVSVVLWGGYWEVATKGGRTDPAAPVARRWFGPGRVLRRAAGRLHRVEVPPGRAAWTLFAHGRRSRPFRFWCPKVGWTDWRPGLAAPGGCPD